jgi:hypothetical protein
MRAAYRKVVPESARDSIFRVRRRGLVRSIRRPFVFASDPAVRDMSKRLESFRAKHAGERCFIVGNGPSLNQTNLDLLKNEYSWGSNKIYLIFPKVEWRPTFYVGVDTLVIPDIRHEIARLVTELPTTSFYFPVRFRESGAVSSSANVFWYNEVEPWEIAEPDKQFATNPAAWVASVRTVTIAAMQFAAFMGFGPIYLIGCDTSYSIPQTAVGTSRNGRDLVSTQDDDPNHFDRSYFGKNSKWHDPRVDMMVAHYEVAKSVCDSLNVEVYNATIGGNLEVFPRVDYESLFK